MWISVITLLLKLIGLGSWADKFFTARAAEKQAQETANAPETNKEVADYWDK